MPTLHGETYIEDYVNHIVNQSLPSALKLDEIKQATSLDKELREISRNIHSTWPAESRQTIRYDIIFFLEMVSCCSTNVY